MCSPQQAPEQQKPLTGTGTLHPSIHPSIHRALHRDFNNYTYTLPLSARAAIMFFITAAAASTQGQWIGDEIFAAMAEYKAPPSAARIIIVTLSSPSDKLWYQGPVKSRATRGNKQTASPAAERSTLSFLYTSWPKHRGTEQGSGHWGSPDACLGSVSTRKMFFTAMLMRFTLKLVFLTSDNSANVTNSSNIR